MATKIFVKEAGPGVQGDSSSLASSLSDSVSTSKSDVDIETPEPGASTLRPSPALEISCSLSPKSSPHASSLYSESSHEEHLDNKGSYRHPVQEKGRKKKSSGTENQDQSQTQPKAT